MRFQAPSKKQYGYEAHDFLSCSFVLKQLTSGHDWQLLNTQVLPFSYK